jgi:cytochrome c-type biogenesis protein CcmE
MKPKNQRLVLVSAALVAVLAAVLLAMWGLRDRASYFYTPAEVVAGKAEALKAIRLGGMVERGSIHRGADGVTTSFVVTDGQARVMVDYRGITPDLFREGSGVVAEGHVQPLATAIDANSRTVGPIFVADTILAKHDERYMPPELGNLAAEHKAGKTLQK